MNYRLNTKVIAAVTILLVGAIGLFVYMLIIAPTEVVAPEQTPGPSDTSEAREEKILTAQHQYVGGTHTIAGTVDMPTPCHKVIPEPFFPNGEQNVVEIRFSTVVEGEECAMVITPTPFRVTFSAPETAAIRATWDGAPARLNLVPVAPGESLGGDYIKG